MDCVVGCLYRFLDGVFNLLFNLNVTHFIQVILMRNFFPREKQIQKNKKSLENELKNLAYTLIKGENKMNAKYH